MTEKKDEKKKLKTFGDLYRFAVERELEERRQRDWTSFIEREEYPVHIFAGPRGFSLYVNYKEDRPEDKETIIQTLRDVLKELE